jgi:hypothetical protein
MCSARYARTSRFQMVMRQKEIVGHGPNTTAITAVTEGEFQ